MIAWLGKLADKFCTIFVKLCDLGVILAALVIIYAFIFIDWS